MKELLIILGLSIASCLPEIEPDSPPVNADSLAISSPCVADVQGLGADGYGWLGLRSDHSVWKGFPAQRVVELGFEVAAISNVDGESLHHCAIKTDGSLWCWGLNLDGQCGNGTPTGELVTPFEVPLSAAVSEVVVSWDFTCARLVDNTVWCWGANGFGQLGTGATTERELVPVQVSGLPGNVSQISAGFDHMCVIAGTDLWCWGGNLYGQIGAGDNTPPAPEHLVPELVMSNVQYISAGGFFNLAIDTTGQVYAWGGNGSGHLGMGDTIDRTVPTLVPALDNMQAVDAGVRSGCGIKSDGSVLCWGFQGSGRLGDGVYAMDDVTQRETPAPVSGPLGQPGGATAIRVAEGTGCAIATDGSLWCWGWGEFLDGGAASAVPIEVDLCGLPMITSVDPPTGSTLGGTHVVIIGDAFQSGAAVEFGEEPGSDVVFVSPTRLEVDGPEHYESTEDVKVTNPDGTVAILLLGFQFLPPPSVWQVVPQRGSINGGDRVTVFGDSLLSGVTVLFDDAAATDATIVEDGVEVTTPVHAAGVVDVTVVNTDSQSGTMEMAFEFVVPPTPAQLDVAVGPTAGGTQVVITGVGFEWNSMVSFGGVASDAVTCVDEMTIAAVTPPHAAGVVDVSVENEDGQIGVLAGGFTYDDDPGNPDGGGGGCCSVGDADPPFAPLAFASLGLLLLFRRRRR